MTQQDQEEMMAFFEMYQAFKASRGQDAPATSTVSVGSTPTAPNTLMNLTHTVDPSTQAPQGGSPLNVSLFNRSLPQYQAPGPPAVYYVTLEQAEDAKAVLVADGVFSADTQIWENGLEIGFGGPAPAAAVRGVGSQCLSFRWYDKDGRPQWQQAGIIYYRLLEFRSARARTGNPIPKFVQTAAGVDAVHFYGG